MRKLFQYLKADFINIMSNPLPSLILLVLLPFGLMQVMSFSMSDMFEPAVTPLEISIKFEDHANNEVSQLLVETMSDESMKDYFLVRKDEDMTDYTIVIPEGYAISKSSPEIRILGESNAKVSESEVLKQFIDRFQISLSDGIEIEQAASKIENTSERQQLVQAVQQIQAMTPQTLLNSEKWENRQNLSSKQYMSINGLSFVFVLCLSSLVTLSTNEKMGGLRKRLAILPLNAFERTTFSIVSDVLVSTLAALIYYLLWKLTESSSFAGNPLIYFLYFISLGALIMSSGHFLANVFPDWVLKTFYQLFNLSALLLAVLPLDRLLGEGIGQLLSQNYFRKIFVNPMIDYHIGNGSGSIFMHAGVFLAMTLVFGAITVFVMNRRGGAEK